MKSRSQFLFSLMLLLLFVFISAVLGQDDEHAEAELNAETKLLLHDVRGANAQYQDLDVALEDGYGEFLSCFTLGEESGMGQHYVNGELVGDDLLDPLAPESLVYEQAEDGSMILVGLEYLVFADVWDPDGEDREAPTLFGQELSLVTEIPDTPPVWALHVWLFAHNPDGLFTHFNPLIFCPEGAALVDLAGA